MSDSKHTPGPWHAEDWSLDDGPNTFTVAAHEPETLSPDQSSIWPNGIRKIKIADTEEGDGDRIANARLIAAAPDLLEVLKEATLALEGLAKGEGIFKPIEQTITLAIAAIAKAEGRP